MTWFDTLTTKEQTKLTELLDQPTGRDARDYARGDVGFGCWLLYSDALCRKGFGVSIFDLADQTWRDWYEDEIDPVGAVKLALAGEGVEL